MKGVIDRFEGDFAIVELIDKTRLDIEKSKLPKEAKEGSSLLIEGGTIVLNLIETEGFKKEIDEIIEGFWK